MFYDFDGVTRPQGVLLREGLNEFRSGLEKLQRVKRTMAQQTDDQIQNGYRFDNPETAAAAKAELAADIPDIAPAVQQMFDQFG